MKSLFYGWLNHSVYHPVKSIFNSHQRRLLLVLISLLTLFSVSLGIFSGYLGKLFFVRSQPSSVVTWIGMCLVCLCLMVVCIVGLRGAYFMNIELLLGFFWGVMVFLAPLVIVAISCFDLYQYIGIFFIHLWSLPSFAGLRQLFCSEFEDTLCAAPNGSKVAIDEWCLQNYNSTDCFDIRSSAIANAIHWSTELTLIQAVASVIILAIILLTIYLCFRILTKAVITESMNDLINYLLMLPIGGCSGMAYYMRDWQYYYGLPYNWSAKLFLSVAVGQAFALPVGIYAGRVKSQLLLSGYIVLVLLIMTGLAIVGTYGLLYAELIPNTVKPSIAQTSFIACQKGMPDCCCCGNNFTAIYLANTTGTTNLCPEWPQNDVIKLLVLDLRVAGVVGLVCIMYLVGALVVAFFTLNYTLRNYKTDFV